MMKIYIVYGRSLLGDKCVRVEAGTINSAMKKAELKLTEKYPELNFYKYHLAKII